MRLNGLTGGVQLDDEPPRILPQSHQLPYTLKLKKDVIAASRMATESPAAVIPFGVSSASRQVTGQGSVGVDKSTSSPPLRDCKLRRGLLAGGLP